MMKFCRQARVAATHPEDNSVDIVMVDDGARYPGVQVLSPYASTNSGVSDLPDVTATNDKWSLTQSTDRDMIAIVAFLSPAVPVVLGFLFPQVNQVLFADKNRKIVRHASDAYSSIDGAANMEVYHPSGTYIRIGEDPAHEDLTGKDYDGDWKITKNTGKSVHVRIGVKNGGAEKASVHIDPSGNISIQCNGNATLNVGGNLAATVGGTSSVDSTGAATLKAPSVTVDAPQSTFKGAVTVQGLLTYQAGLTGSGGSGASLTGSMTVTGNVVTTGTLTNNGKSVGSTHTHSGVQTGGGNTGAPT